MRLACCLILAFAAGFAGTAATQPLQMRLSEILGREVVRSDNEPLAIRDLVIDIRTRKVVYLALAPAHSEASELILYPVSALRSGGTGLMLVLPEGSASSGESAPQAHVRASRLLGFLVKDAAGKELGRIKDLALRVADGALSFALLDADAGTEPLRVPAEAFLTR
jgi:sporulation protein YlmC with PRC-barrel domain